MESDAILALATRAVDERLGPLLAAYGFRPVRLEQRSDGTWMSRGWIRHAKAGQRPTWVDLSVSVDSRDIPWFVGLSFGADQPGSFVDREQRAVPLWRYVDDSSSARDGYGFKGATDVGTVIGRAIDDLTTHAADFLAGDLITYDRLRGRVVPFPRTVIGLSLVGQLLLMPWRAVWWVLRGGPRRMRDAERAMLEEFRRKDED